MKFILLALACATALSLAAPAAEAKGHHGHKHRGHHGHHGHHGRGDRHHHAGIKLLCGTATTVPCQP